MTEINKNTANDAAETPADAKGTEEKAPKTRIRDYADVIAAAYAAGEDAEQTGAAFTSLGDR